MFFSKYVMLNFCGLQLYPTLPSYSAHHHVFDKSLLVNFRLNMMVVFK